MACLDTSALIDLMRPRSAPRALSVLEPMLDAGEALRTTRINAAELYVGVERSLTREQERRRVDDLLGRLEILELDDAGARMFGAMTAALQRAGRPVGDLDVLIAAAAHVHGESLVTRNPRRFVDIPGLRVVPY